MHTLLWFISSALIVITVHRSVVDVEAFSATKASKNLSGGDITSAERLLLDSAKSIDESLEFFTTDGKKKNDVDYSFGKYAPSGWSNRLGTVLTPAAERIYTADRPFYWNNIDVGGRMTVIQLSSKNNDKNGDYDLWIHSPIDLDEATRAAIDQLGTVKYVVSPNYEHLKYAEQWHKAYPDAYMWGCPGLMERLPNIRWEEEIPANIGLSSSTTPSSVTNCWDFEELVPLHLNFEVNPFTGRPFFNEVIFFHKPTKALMTTDVYWNYPRNGIPYPNGDWELAPTVESIPIGSLIWKFGMDRIYLPFYKNLMIRDKDSYSKMVSTVLDEWEPELIVPCHGDVIRGKDTVRSILSKHFSA
eukprot:CAMPEP_0113459100 /NCGR_PEP_ID=MMETSP0014_2-20120614/10272_1 /TAXON_ID=2857 /ORGANISM="Nitzschia sp." /LENGTH=357 /DNA_ID=CAMNT_0000350661 /DNA_START=355 /DNA_END=1428 /DNA_ORIENTATION=+ /assembly_acc=CAM_ASM_000159